MGVLGGWLRQRAILPVGPLLICGSGTLELGSSLHSMSQKARAERLRRQGVFPSLLELDRQERIAGPAMAGFNLPTTTRTCEKELADWDGGAE